METIAERKERQAKQYEEKKNIIFTLTDLFTFHDLKNVKVDDSSVKGQVKRERIPHLHNPIRQQKKELLKKLGSARQLRKWVKGQRPLLEFLKSA